MPGQSGKLDYDPATTSLDDIIKMKLQKGLTAQIGVIADESILLQNTTGVDANMECEEDSLSILLGDVDHMANGFNDEGTTLDTIRSRREARFSIDSNNFLVNDDDDEGETLQQIRQRAALKKSDRPIAEQVSIPPNENLRNGVVTRDLREVLNRNNTTSGEAQHSALSRRTNSCNESRRSLEEELHNFRAAPYAYRRFNYHPYYADGLSHSKRHSFPNNRGRPYHNNRGRYNPYWQSGPRGGPQNGRPWEPRARSASPAPDRHFRSQSLGPGGGGPDFRQPFNRSRSPGPSAYNSRPLSPGPSGPGRSFSPGPQGRYFHRAQSPGPNFRASYPGPNHRSQSPGPNGHTNFRSRSPGPNLHTNYRSHSPGPFNRSRSPGPNWNHHNFRSQSPGPNWHTNYRSQSPGPFNRSGSPGPNNHYRSQSPGPFNRSRSPGPNNHYRSQSPGPFNRSQSPGPNNHYRSQSPGPFNRSQSPGPNNHYRSQSPGPFNRSRSPGPNWNNHYRSRSPGPSWQSNYRARSPGPSGPRGHYDRSQSPAPRLDYRRAISPGPQGPWSRGNPRPGQTASTRGGRYSWVRERPARDSNEAAASDSAAPLTQENVASFNATPTNSHQSDNGGFGVNIQGSFMK